MSPRDADCTTVWPPCYGSVRRYTVAVIRRIQALRYRCLRYVDLDLDRFHVLIGPNASGKSTLFDAVSFLGDLVRDGLASAVERRTQNFQDMVWNRPDSEPRFELAVEFDIPEQLLKRLPADGGYRRFRYEIAVGETGDEVRLQAERGILTPEIARIPPRQRTLFPDPQAGPETLLEGGGRRGRRTVLSKSAEGSASFNLETATRPGKGWVTSIALGHHRSALANLPESPDTFPVSTLVKHTLRESIRPLFLESRRMREASPPSRRGNGFAPDGSSLPWTVSRLREERPELYRDWMNHVRTALPDLEDVGVIVRDDDRHAYLKLRYDTGLEAPSWMVSDGTLRLLALTLLAYVPESGNIYLLEEPENGVHPLSLDAIHDSLSSVYVSQVLAASHSPDFLNRSRPEQVLCLARNAAGATDVVRGADHPYFQSDCESRRRRDLEILFSSGLAG